MALRREGQVAVLTPIAPDKRGLPAVKNWSKRIQNPPAFQRRGE